MQVIKYDFYKKFSPTPCGIQCPNFYTNAGNEKIHRFRDSSSPNGGFFSWGIAPPLFCHALERLGKRIAVSLVEKDDLDSRRQVQAVLRHDTPDNPLATVATLAVFPVVGNTHGLCDLAVDDLEKTIAVPIAHDLDGDGLVAPNATETGGGEQALVIGGDFSSSHGGNSRSSKGTRRTRETELATNSIAFSLATIINIHSETEKANGFYEKSEKVFARQTAGQQVGIQCHHTVLSSTNDVNYF
ncbi:MAG: hypothetical protein EOM83_15730 [Clostridia bacterium]|nr:hypothetical protein [Clostridia bacterium]